MANGQLCRTKPTPVGGQSSKIANSRDMHSYVDRSKDRRTGWRDGVVKEKVKVIRALEVAQSAIDARRESEGDSTTSIPKLVSQVQLTVVLPSKDRVPTLLGYLLYPSFSFLSFYFSLSPFLPLLLSTHCFSYLEPRLRSSPDVLQKASSPE